MKKRMVRMLKNKDNLDKSGSGYETKNCIKLIMITGEKSHV